MNSERLLKSQRLCLAVTGLSPDEVRALLPAFEGSLVQYRYELRPKERRMRKLGGGRKGHLPTGLDKLVFVLLYLKVYPTFDVLGFLTNRQRSKCCESVHTLVPVLELTLGRKLALPQRKVTSVDEFFRLFPEAKDVFIDGTERPVQKPVSPKRRKRLYSGKRKATTRKTIVITDERKQILIMSPTKSGRRHDKRIVDKFGIIEAIPDTVTIWGDTGFQGIQHTHPNSCLPKKGTKKHPLSDDQKTENRVVSGIRIVAEHAIGGVKRYKAASDTYRNKLPNLDDTFMYLAAGLWNFHLRHQTA